MLSKTSAELSGCKLKYNAAKTEFEGREIYNRQAGELLKIMKLKELKESAGKLKESIRHSENILKETIEGIGKIKLLQGDLKDSIQKWKLKYPDMSVLSDVREWYAIKKQLESANMETASEINTLLAEIEDIHKMNSRLWQEECFSEIPASNDLAKTLDLLENKKNGINMMKDRLRHEIEHLSLQARLEEYASNLEEGKPCPLCGSLTHPMPLNSQNVKDAIGLIRQQSIDCDRLIHDIELNQKKLRETESRIQAKRDGVEKLKHKLIEQNTKTALHKDQFKWDDYKEESELRDRILTGRENTDTDKGRGKTARKYSRHSWQKITS